MNFLAKIGLLILVSVFTSAYSFADDSSFNGNINAGNWRVGGSFSLSDSTSGDPETESRTTLSISPIVQYFVINHLALGFTLGFQTNFGDNSNTIVGVGPVITYYFLTFGKAALFAHEGIEFLHSGSLDNSYWANNLRVGLDYFATPSVAFGPALQWVHTFPGTYSDYANENYALTAGFSIFL